MKLCIDCQWHVDDPKCWSSAAREQGHRCSFGEGFTDPVTGEKYQTHSISECYLLRRENGNCGPAAENFEPKHKEAA